MERWKRLCHLVVEFSADAFENEVMAIQVYLAGRNYRVVYWACLWIFNGVCKHIENNFKRAYICSLI